jgi:hypothetical protein
MTCTYPTCDETATSGEEVCARHLVAQTLGLTLGGLIETMSCLDCGVPMPEGVLAHSCGRTPS